jgi:hypothetical protein
MVDTPTQNYATLNPLFPTVGGFGFTPTEANLRLTLSTGANAFYGEKGMQVPSTGKWYWDCTVVTRDPAAGAWILLGIIASNLDLAVNTWLGSYNGGYDYANTGNKEANTSSVAYGATYTNGDVIGVAFDVDAATLTFYKNGVSQGLAFSSVTTASGFCPAFQIYRSAGTAQDIAPNFGQRPFTYTPPTGFKALCTANEAITAPTASGTFAGTLNADGPFVWIGGVPSTLTINSNAVTFGTHADKTAGGFKLRTASASYNNTGSNTWSATFASPSTNSAFAHPQPAQGNP